jgi:alpha-L-rhamnosidase
VLGVRLASPGWNEVIIAPNISGLTWARGTVPLPDQGRIDVAWRVDEINKTFNITIQHPKAISVKIQLPSGYQTDVKVTEL